MRDFFRNKVVTVLILAATLILAGIAIFTAIRLYQLRQQAVAPTATARPTATPTKAPTAKSTTGPSLPSSGTSWPTLVGIGVGVILIIGSLLLSL